MPAPPPWQGRAGPGTGGPGRGSTPAALARPCAPRRDLPARVGASPPGRRRPGPRLTRVIALLEHLSDHHEAGGIVVHREHAQASWEVRGVVVARGGRAGRPVPAAAGIGLADGHRRGGWRHARAAEPDCFAGPAIRPLRRLAGQLHPLLFGCARPRARTWCGKARGTCPPGAPALPATGCARIRVSVVAGIMLRRSGRCIGARLGAQIVPLLAAEPGGAGGASKGVATVLYAQGRVGAPRVGCVRGVGGVCRCPCD